MSYRVASFLKRVLIASIVFAAQAVAADCAALKAMSEEPTELVAKKDNIQRSEWLLLEYLSSDKSSKKTLEAEVAQSMQRAQGLMERMRALAPLAESQPPPQEGSPECAKFEQFKTEVENTVVGREKEVAAYHKKFGFVYSCERIAQSLVAHHKLMNSPDTEEQTKKFASLALDAGTGPFQMSARVTGAHMHEMTKQAEEPLDLEPRQRYAYFALSCLKRYQKQESNLKPPKEIQAQLKACPTGNWTQLGMCVSKAALSR